jgi:hypothetical protein
MKRSVKKRLKKNFERDFFLGVLKSIVSNGLVVSADLIASFDSSIAILSFDSSCPFDSIKKLEVFFELIPGS